jgi:ABC-type spermidine/putrescine transport system permease subunit I
VSTKSFSAPGIAFALPGALVIALYLIWPVVILFGQALMDAATGRVDGDAFVAVLTNESYLRLIGRSLTMATAVTLLSVAISWPAAWALARYVTEKRRYSLLAVVIIPFLTSQLLLIYAVLVLLGAGGPLMWLLVEWGLQETGSTILYTATATFIMFVYESVSFIILILFPAAERISANHLNAMRSLGASGTRQFFDLVLPLSHTSLMTAISITFVATAGAFAESAILGGANGALIGNIIADRIRNGAEPAVTSALAVTLLVIGILGVVVFRALTTLPFSARFGRGRN